MNLMQYIANNLRFKTLCVPAYSLFSTSITTKEAWHVVGSVLSFIHMYSCNWCWWEWQVWTEWRQKSPYCFHQFNSLIKSSVVLIPGLPVNLWTTFFPRVSWLNLVFCAFYPRGLCAVERITGLFVPDTICSMTDAWKVRLGSHCFILVSSTAKNKEQEKVVMFRLIDLFIFFRGKHEPEQLWDTSLLPVYILICQLKIMFTVTSILCTKSQEQ